MSPVSADFSLYFIYSYIFLILKRCELTQGGRSLSKTKFTYRRFNFDGGALQGNIYHYSDSWCTKPSFTIKFQGSYTVSQRNSTSKYIISNPSVFKFNKIKFTSPHKKAVEEFIDFMIEKCPNAIPAIKTNYELDLSKLVNTDIEIDDLVLKKKHCRFFLALHPYSYAKTRLVRDRKHSKLATLYFGDIPAFTVSQMHNYQPSKFQYGLARVDRPQCKICQLGKDANVAPILPAPSLENNFVGSWVTKKCEAVNENFYVTTIYMFEKENERVTQLHAFFSDQDCKKNSFTYTLSGSYTSYRPSGGEIHGLIGLRMTSSEMHLTPYNTRTLSMLRNAKRCGKREQWELGQEQDVTGTGGCPDMFSVSLPYTNNVLLRAGTIENRPELYIEDENSGLRFSYNLVPCDTMTSTIHEKQTTEKPTEPNKMTKPTLPNINKVIVDKQIEKVLSETYNKQNKQPSGGAVNTKSSALMLLGLTLIVFMI